MTGLFDDLAMPGRVTSNRLFYGDNLTIMQNMPSACADLIYLDPPFNSQPEVATRLPASFPMVRQAGPPLFAQNKTGLSPLGLD